MATSGVDRAAEAFANELARWRMDRGMSKKQLAGLMGFDPSYVSHIEGRRHRPTEDFARRAETVLAANGAIWQRFQEYEEARHGRGGTALITKDVPIPPQWLPPGTGLVVEHEEALLAYVGGEYVTTVRRALYNAGTEPVSRYLIRVAVDRYPGDPDRSNRHHRDHPLSIEELSLEASCGDAGAAEPMNWRIKQDRDAFKEIWLLFENSEGRFPLYPGERTAVTYSYRVGEEKWGSWFQRAVRLPTRRMTVRIDLPSSLDPQVWGVETSMSAEETPLRTLIERETDGDRTIFTWTTESPSLNARFRLQWRFRAIASAPPAMINGTADSYAHRLASVGVVQWPVPEQRVPTAAEMRTSALPGHPLRSKARRLDLPAEEDQARQIVSELMQALDEITRMHLFGKGVGLAAPQLGIDACAAVVWPPGRSDPIVLLNPSVVNASAQEDDQPEGCLSYFDFRGGVRRPLRIEVEHQRYDGGRVVSTFERGLARLVSHEVDHLSGRLYIDRMPGAAALTPLSEYASQPWAY
ncbi:peptide deformylase [Hamadaea tsunoensis]|uniref:peptide deformylase n=1 Tax=Hamadaea tsunoensis TaxID=53368 RepID=UPI000426FCE4|nr:peptide deformylase [Hamadaea tsunoensis]